MSKLLLRYAEESGIDYGKKLGVKIPRCDLSDGKIPRPNSFDCFAILNI